MTGDTPPVLEGAPTAKQKKYDRQLRLWAASGQAALEEAHILLINSGPGVVGVETLENLILPGIGKFTVLDSAIVQQSDLGVNFFLEDTALGGFRAEHSCNYLKELNPDVEGHFISEPIESFISEPDALNPYTLILVAAPIDPEILFRISQHASSTDTPLFFLHSVGFYSHFSIQLPHAFPIVDTHPDPESTTDLRLLKPWQELSALAAEKTKGLEKMDTEEHGHVPYVLLLLHYIEVWKSSHDGKPPQTYKEKNEFKQLVNADARLEQAEGEENYEQAVAAVLKNFNMPEASSSVREVFKAEECVKLSAKSTNFWIIANAMSQFYQKNAVLPLPGSVPDMKAKSADYIQLQTVYKEKARNDVAAVLELVRQLEKSLNRSTSIDEKEVEAFCKNAAHIKLVRGRPLQVICPGETLQWGTQAKSAVNKLTDPDSLILLYIAFLAFDSFCASHPADDLASRAHPPTSMTTVDEDEDVEQNPTDTDEEKMIGIAHKIIDDVIKEAGRTIQVPEYSELRDRAGQIVTEIVRAAGGELHNISALTGGLVAQEVIKVVTKQYVPVDNACLFDGVYSKTAVLKA